MITNAGHINMIQRLSFNSISLLFLAQHLRFNGKITILQAACCNAYGILAINKKRSFLRLIKFIIELKSQTNGRPKQAKP